MGDAEQCVTRRGHAVVSQCITHTQGNDGRGGAEEEEELSSTLTLRVKTL